MQIVEKGYVIGSIKTYSLATSKVDIKISLGGQTCYIKNTSLGRVGIAFKDPVTFNSEQHNGLDVREDFYLLEENEVIGPLYVSDFWCKPDEQNSSILIMTN